MPERPAASLIALMGPTASGKSALALELAMALEGQGIPCEIVTADSMQVYRGMDIGTAKPDPRERARVPHHLIDVVEPTENFNVSQYRLLADPLLDRLIGEGKAVLVAGGTGLYIKALIDGLKIGKVAGVGLDVYEEEEGVFFEDLSSQIGRASCRERV